MYTERAFTKLLIVFAFSACVFYYMKIDEQGVYLQDTYKIEFENVKFSYEVRKHDVKCATKTILIAISSAPNAFNLRMAFRNEWTKQSNSSVIYQFFVGFTGNESVREANFKESENFNDTVVTRIFDTFKTYSVFNWQQSNCPNLKYILKSQDNTLISIQRLLYWIDNEFENEHKSSDGKVIFCRTKEYYDETVNHKFKSNNQSGIEYCEDGTYLVSSTAVKLMLSKAANETLKNSVDNLMFTGLLAEAVGVKRIHSPKYFTSSLTNCGCDKNNIPYIIASRVQSNVNSTFAFDYSSAAEKFENMSCSQNSNYTIEFFKTCIARVG